MLNQPVLLTALFFVSVVLEHPQTLLEGSV